MPDQYASVNRYRFGNAEVVIYRPTITEDERQKREASVKTALEKFGRAMTKAKANESGDAN